MRNAPWASSAEFGVEQAGLRPSAVLIWCAMPASSSSRSDRERQRVKSSSKNGPWESILSCTPPDELAVQHDTVHRDLPTGQVLQDRPVSRYDLVVVVPALLPDHALDLLERRFEPALVQDQLDVFAGGGPGRLDDEGEPMFPAATGAPATSSTGWSQTDAMLWSRGTSAGEACRDRWRRPNPAHELPSAALAVSAISISVSLKVITAVAWRSRAIWTAVCTNSSIGVSRGRLATEA